MGRNLGPSPFVNLKSIKTVVSQQPDCEITDLFDDRLHDLGFDAKQIFLIRDLIEEICNDCWNVPAENCYCWRDE